MKRRLLIFIAMVLPLMAMSQGVITRPTKQPTKTAPGKKHPSPPSNANGGRKLIQPAAPTSITERNRTIYDLLYFPYGCLSKEIDTKEKAQEALYSNFGFYENVNGSGIGLHRNKGFDYSYQGVPIGLCWTSWYDNHSWFHFYLHTKSEADKFYNILVDEIAKAGIPLEIDKIYGGCSNRKHPVSIFKWVYVQPANKIEEEDNSNINISDYVGMYLVVLGVYKFKPKQ